MFPPIIRVAVKYCSVIMTIKAVLYYICFLRRVKLACHQKQTNSIHFLQHATRYFCTLCILRRFFDFNAGVSSFASDSGRAHWVLPDLTANNDDKMHSVFWKNMTMMP